MKLPHRWHCKFIESTQRVEVWKHQHNGKLTLTLERRGPFLTRINPKTGNAVQNRFHKLPPDAAQIVLAECAARWGEQ